VDLSLILPTTARSRSAHPAHNQSVISWRARHYADLTREHGFEPLRLEGKVPADLQGTLYRSGPATSGRFGKPYVHMFEGDGAIAAVRFNDSKVTGAARLLRSAGYLEEENAGKALYQSAASPAQRFKRFVQGKQKNTGNTSVMNWNGSLYALMEIAPPLAFDRELNTIGDTTLGGVVRGAFSAHPHAVVSRRTTYNFGANWGLNAGLCTYALPWGGEARLITELKLDKPVMLHDFAATEKHLVFLVSPARFKLSTLLLGFGDAADFLAWHPEDGTEVIIVPIDAPDQVRRFRIEPFFQIHVAGGFEQGDFTCVDVFRYADSSVMKRNIQEIDKPAILGDYVRLYIPHHGEHVHSESLSATGLEFGSVDARYAGSSFRYTHAITIENDRDGLVRVDTVQGTEEKFFFSDYERMGEPVFVPRSAQASEGDGYILTLCYQGKTHTSYWGVFDTRSISDGPILKAHYDHHIPSGFHGAWVND
jgi:all-trans-8'-apo-beta-carotenal 15,15'-oxygenase